MINSKFNLIYNIKLITERVLKKVPWLYNLKLYIKYLIRLKYNLEKQLSFKSSKPAIKDNCKRVLIPAIETSHYQFHQILITAKAMKLRGAEVKVLVCDSFLKGCEIKNSKDSKLADPCLNCNFNQNHILDYYGLDVILLSSIFSNEDIDFIKKKSADLLSKEKKYFNKFDLTRIVNESVTRHFYGANAKSKKDHDNVIYNHLFTSITSYMAAKKINDLFKPNIIFNSMNVYSSWEPYYNYFSEVPNVDLFTLSITAFNYNAVILNQMDLYKSPKRFYDYLSTRNNKNLIKSERHKLYDFLNTRKSGDSKIFLDHEYYKKDSKVEEVLSLDENKNNILLVSNSYWDVGLSESGRLYNDVIDWVLDTIDIVSKIKNTHLYIKIHPAEEFDSSSSLKGVKDFIYEKYSTLPDYLSLIVPEMKINPSELFPFIDIAILFNGTLGLEVLFENIPVIITGKAPYSNLKLVNEPINKIEYKNLLNGSKKLINPKKKDYELFAYYYFIKTCIPWNLTKSAYADDFKGFTFDTLEDILPGKNKYLDHVCNCILKSSDTNIDNW